MVETDTPPEEQRWQDPGFVQNWMRHDTQELFLEFPRQLTAVIVAAELKPSTILDIGSGPGSYLGTLLRAFPDAHGISLDSSEVMVTKAQENLAEFGDRVSFMVWDMADMAAAPLPSPVDLIVTARALHHLDAAGLNACYSSAYQHLREGGWLANLDHVRSTEPWHSRLLSARLTLLPRSSEAQGHPHPNPLPSVEEHLGALHQAGFANPKIAWQSCLTYLFLAKRESVTGSISQKGRRGR